VTIPVVVHVDGRVHHAPEHQADRHEDDHEQG
jgi:hypothetical protein